MIRVVLKTKDGSLEQFMFQATYMSGFFVFARIHKAIVYSQQLTYHQRTLACDAGYSSLDLL